MSALSNTPATPINQITGSNPAGTLMGSAAADLIAFYGGTPVAQRASAVQVAVATTVSTTSQYGYAQAQADAIVATLNEVVATLTALGLWKGGA